MRKYIRPEMEIVEFDEEDVIVTSGETGNPDNGNEWGTNPPNSNDPGNDPNSNDDERPEESMMSDWD